MSKYDFDLDLNTNNTMKLINDMILPNTEILEFGCACGRLTKHLNMNKNCRVTIVEIDKDAGEEASKYAEESYIGDIEGDIEKYIWSEKISSKFDYIIFADVLEHLYYPEKVLKKCKEFLNENGSIIVSIPNIAHNSILIELINSRFNYQRTGLLDDTHIKFFTYESFKKMLDGIGLFKSKEFATYSKVGENEFNNSFNDVSKYIEKEFIKRPKGNVYQYVYEIKSDTCLGNNECESHISDYEFCDYFISVFPISNEKEIFGDEIPIRKRYIPEENKVNKFKLDFDKEQFIKKLRIDPIECNCVINIESITGFYQGEEFNIDIDTSNCELNINNNYFFTTDDPQLFTKDLNRKIENIIITFKFLEYEVFNKEKFSILSHKLQHDKNIINQKEDYINEQRKELDDKRIVIEQKEDYINEQRKELEERRIIIEQKQDYIEQQRKDLEEHKAVIQQKENYIQEQRNELNRIKNSKYYKLYIKLKTVLGGKA